MTFAKFSQTPAAVVSLSLATFSAPTALSAEAFSGTSFPDPISLTLDEPEHPFLNATVPLISKKTIERIGALLELPREQQASAETLYQGYVSEQRTSGQALMKKFDEALRAEKEKNDASLLEAFPQRHRENAEEKWKLRSTFLRDLKSLLTPVQVEAHWDADERLLRREYLLYLPLIGSTCWTQVDLIKITEVMELSAEERQAIAPLLDAYDRGVDRALIPHEPYWKAATTERPLEQIMENWVADVEIGRRCVELNKKYFREIGAALGDTSRDKLDEAVSAIAYKFIFEQSHPAKAGFVAALAFTDLTEDQRERVLLLQGRYTEASMKVDEAARAKSDEADLAESRLPAREACNRNEEGKTPGLIAWKELIEARKEYEAKTNEELKLVLKPAQIERLPKPKNEEEMEAE